MVSLDSAVSAVVKTMETIDEETKQEYRKMFDAFDTNGDQRICSNELETLMLAIGYDPDKATLKEIMKEADTNGNGYIEFEEFVEMLEATPKAPDEAAMVEAFKMFDKNKDGTIDRMELMNILSMGNAEIRVSEDDIDELMAECDTNKDGVLQYDEFVKLMMKR